jgi:SAM-dependent methyltransferase
MSTAYEQGGRARQKQRTRAALVEAARRLLAAGRVPSVDEAAAEAAISRTTAYRYFSSQAELLVAAHPELTPSSLLPDEVSGGAAARLAAAVDELTRITRDHEAQLRAVLRASLDPSGPAADELALRRGRAIAWLEEALAPAGGLSPDERRRLAIAIRAAAGIEALVWLTDVAGLDRDGAASLQRWMAQALLSAALRDPPPALDRPAGVRTGRGGSVTDLFRDKAADWDSRPVPQQISDGVVRAMLARVPLSPDLVVMDFGAGTGLIARGLAPYVAHLHAVDVSDAMLAQLAAKEELRGKVTAHCQDLLTQPLDLRVDLVVSAMAMHHVEDTAGLLAAFHAHLRPGGRVALADLDAEDGPFHPPGTVGVYHSGFDRDALGAQLTAAGFEDVRFETATVVKKDGRDYPIFLVTARRA